MIYCHKKWFLAVFCAKKWFTGAKNHFLPVQKWFFTQENDFEATQKWFSWNDFWDIFCRFWRCDLLLRKKHFLRKWAFPEMNGNHFFPENALQPPKSLSNTFDIDFMILDWCTMIFTFIFCWAQSHRNTWIALLLSVYVPFWITLIIIYITSLVCDIDDFSHISFHIYYCICYHQGTNTKF